MTPKVSKKAMQRWRRTARATLGKRANGRDYTGVVLYEGPSMLTGEPIAVVATGFARASDNAKTGDMIQIWIFPTSELPHRAVKSGADSAVCGDCKHRPYLGGSCYVVVHNAPRQVAASYAAGEYARLSPEAIAVLFRGALVRFGSWGDPAAVPFEVWAPLLDVAMGWTGYTHQWRNLPDPRWRVFMASTDTAREYFEAKRMGWRCFLVHNEDSAPIGRTCPAAPEAPTANRVSCDTCRLCDGTARGAKRPDVAIRVHGVKSGRFSDYAEQGGY